MQWLMEFVVDGQRAPLRVYRRLRRPLLPPTATRRPVSPCRPSRTSAERVGTQESLDIDETSRAMLTTLLRKQQVPRRQPRTRSSSATTRSNLRTFRSTSPTIRSTHSAFWRQGSGGTPSACCSTVTLHCLNSYLSATTSPSISISTSPYLPYLPSPSLILAATYSSPRE